MAKLTVYECSLCKKRDESSNTFKGFGLNAEKANKIKLKGMGVEFGVIHICHECIRVIKEKT